MNIETQALLKLIDALHRKDTIQDGNWGWPTFYEELNQIKDMLQPPTANGEEKKDE